jgi:L-seryl-tRNA(Ser) seleniumtransferase
MAKEIIAEPRDFPSVEELLQEPRLAGTVALVPRPIATTIIQRVIAEYKKRLKSKSSPLTFDEFLEDIGNSLCAASRLEISRVLNATGVVVHTNLGRSPISEAMFDRVKKTVTGYGNVEYALEEGTRGSRGQACETYLATLAESEAATVVNNCAAALFVILNTLATRRKVLISRGELVQIGGGFRIPEILKRAGAKLCEIGTTNITTLADYEANADDQTALILKVHKSNFVQAGFTEEVALKELVALGRKRGIPVVNDLGSGVFVPTRPILGHDEPTVQQSVRAGADLTCFSGDKMLGGVQAGLIAGRSEMIKKVKKNPIFRTIRVDKFVFAMLEQLLACYLNGTYQTDVKLWSLLSVPESELYRRGKEILKILGNPRGVSVEATRSYIGGGAFPEKDIPSVGICFDGSRNPDDLMTRFRRYSTPIIGRIDDNRFILDLKAVDLEDLPVLTDAIRSIIG